MSLMDKEIDLSKVFSKVYIDDSPELLEGIRKFTFLWMCFEKNFISSHGHSSKNSLIKDFSRKYYKQINDHSQLCDIYIDCAKYFHSRYQDPDIREKLGYFLNNNGLPNHAQIGINHFLDSDFDRILDIKKLECCLQIIYRYYCNLFDTSERVQGFGCQVENIRQANFLLYHLNIVLLA